MVVEIGGTLIFGLSAAPILSLALVVFIIILCAGKRKDGDLEDGVLKSSGSYTQKSDEQFADASKTPGNVKPENEIQVSTKPGDIIINPAVDANINSTDTMLVTENQLYAVARPREPSPHVGRKSLKETSGPYDSARDGRTELIENSGSAEVSADAMYARVSSVRRQEPEIAYSVVELKDRETEYEFVDNHLKRKSSVDVEAPLKAAVESEPDSASTYAVVRDEDKPNSDKGFPGINHDTAMPDIYSKVDESQDKDEPRRASSGNTDGHMGSTGGELYATVTEAPKHNSLPPSSKGGLSKFSIFKQSKRRSRTVDESAATSDSQKVAERKASKKKQHSNTGKSAKPGTDDASSPPPPPPPPPPVESLKSIAKEKNRQRSGVDELGGRSGETTPASSPRMGALPSIPVSKFHFDRVNTEDYDDDDGTYEQLGMGAPKSMVSATKEQPTNPGNEKEVDIEGQKVLETQRTLSQESHKSINESVDGDRRASNPLSLPPNTSDTTATSDGQTSIVTPNVTDVYAQVDKSKSSSKTDNELQPGFITTTTTHDFPSLDIYAKVNKKRNSVQDALDCEGNINGSADRRDTELASLYTTVDISAKNTASIKERRSKSTVESHSELKLVVTSIEDSETDHVMKKRAHTAPMPDELLDPSVKKNVYAQVDFDRKKQTRLVGETYAKLNKVATSKKLVHQSPTSKEIESEQLYEGAYNLISENVEGDVAMTEETGYETAGTPLTKESNVQLESNPYSLPDNTVYDNDDENYERVEDLK